MNHRPGTFPHGAHDFSFDAVIREIDRAIGRKIKPHGLRIVNRGDDAVFIHARFGHLDYPMLVRTKLDVSPPAGAELFTKRASMVAIDGRCDDLT